MEKRLDRKKNGNILRKAHVALEAYGEEAPFLKKLTNFQWAVIIQNANHTLYRNDEFLSIRSLAWRKIQAIESGNVAYKTLNQMDDRRDPWEYLLGIVLNEARSAHDFLLACKVATSCDSGMVRIYFKRKFPDLIARCEKDISEIESLRSLLKSSDFEKHFKGCWDDEMFRYGREADKALVEFPAFTQNEKALFSAAVGSEFNLCPEAQELALEKLKSLGKK
ncbi:MAG TPA: hypothetical protein PLB52_04365 [Candidatus Moranbacteria bacterium]|nr:hypothetical protein [Candidatus Moranbacteria bacterium]